MEWIRPEDKLPEEDRTLLIIDTMLGGLPQLGRYDSFTGTDGTECKGFFSRGYMPPLRVLVTHYCYVPALPEVD